MRDAAGLTAADVAQMHGQTALAQLLRGGAASAEQSDGHGGDAHTDEL